MALRRAPAIAIALFALIVGATFGVSYAAALAVDDSATSGVFFAVLGITFAVQYALQVCLLVVLAGATAWRFSHVSCAHCGRCSVCTYYQSSKDLWFTEWLCRGPGDDLEVVSSDRVLLMCFASFVASAVCGASLGCAVLITEELSYRLRGSNASR